MFWDVPLGNLRVWFGWKIGQPSLLCLCFTTFCFIYFLVHLLICLFANSFRAPSLFSISWFLSLGSFSFFTFLYVRVPSSQGDWHWPFVVGLFAVGSLLLAGFASSFLVPLVLWIGSDGLIVNTGFTNVAKSKRFCFVTHFDTLDILLVNVV